MEKCKSIRGFTLIELLVVIAIIAVLAAILFPVFMNAKDQARKAACLSHMKQVGLAYMMYAGDFGALLPVWVPGRPPGAPPPSADVVGSGVRITWYEVNSYNWCETLFRYTRSAKVYMCPSAVYNLVHAPGDRHILTSYKAVLWSANPNIKGTPPWSNLGWYNNTIPEGAVARPKESIVLTDTKYYSDTMCWDSGDYHNMYRAILFDWRLDTNPIYENYRPHFNRPNFLFCDGHAANGPYSKYARNRHWYIDKGLDVRDW